MFAMTETNSAQNKLAVLLNAIEDRLRDLQPALADKGLLRFARAFFRAQSYAELALRGEETLCAEALCAWRHFEGERPNGARLRIFNPCIEEFGWQSTNTVVFLHAKDKPFLVDSMRMELIRQGYDLRVVRHAIFSVQRDASGSLAALDVVRQPSVSTESLEPVEKESFQSWEISRQTSLDKMQDLEKALEKVLSAIDVVVGDYAETLNCLHALKTQYGHLRKSGIATIKNSDAQLFMEDWQALIEWLIDDHFTFLGAFARARVEAPTLKDLSRCLRESMGLLRTDFQADVLDEVNFHERLMTEGVVFTKSSTRSPLHRSAYMDVIVFPLLDQTGELIGGLRLLGLFTAKVYNTSCLAIPLMRDKIRGILHGSDFPIEGHDYKSLMQTLEVYPRDELFQVPAAELLQTCQAIVQIQERSVLRLFLRKDLSGRFVSAMIFTPRDSFSTALRERYERVLSREIGATELSFTTYFSESRLARVHLILRLGVNPPETIDVKALEQALEVAGRDWCDEFADALAVQLGEERAQMLVQTFGAYIPEAYKADFSPQLAVTDFRQIDAFTDQRRVHISLRQEPSDSSCSFHIKVIYQQRDMSLTDLMPMLENLGLKVLSAAPYELDSPHHKTTIIDFSVLYGGVEKPDIVSIKQPVERTLLSIWRGACDSDRFNHLVISGQLEWDQVVVLRAYARFLKQLRFALSPNYIARVLATHGELTQKLIALFEVRFHPDFEGDRVAEQGALQSQILEALKGVESLDDDSVIRNYLALILATVRTNRYQRNAQGDLKDYVALKFTPRQLPFAPKPAPLWEAFVYAPTVEGVHLRSGEIARGGIRWSDRLEDYRQEILGLMKAQRVKNCAIVPSGAKGGFILKRGLATLTADQVKSTVEKGYRLYIRGLLDMIDNLDGDQVKPADQVVAYDGQDTYIVAAPDKGTATFSDMANEEAANHGFWLGDAFASGGSLGYDHKVMGITAKTGWLAVENHLRSAGIQPESQDFTVIGVGDMGGDVFGNGMVLSKHIRLVAAFNHKWIFIDPNPVAATSFKERERLFNTPGGGDWANYDEQCLSKGGAVYSRRLKSISLSPEAKKTLEITEDHLTPDALIHALLKAPVDLLWSAGIGTYVKASHETHQAVADKQNDELRVDATQLRCKAVGEGGNLGMTQAARIEFAAQGGLVNTDFIDNVGGVACSDREVLLKILFDTLVRDGDMTVKQRNKLLCKLTEAVSDSVMLSARRQVMALSMVTRVATTKVEEHRRLIKVLEDEMDVDRAVENLPDDDQLDYRRASGLGLTRPELAVVLAYTKLHAKEQILRSDLPDEPFLTQELNLIFSDEVLKTYEQPLKHHPLRRHMIATVLANSMVNMIGIQYLQRMRDSTGASVVDATRAFVAVREIFQVRAIWASLEANRAKLNMGLHVDSLNMLGRLLRRCARWLLRNRRSLENTEVCVQKFGPPLAQVLELLPEVLDEERRQELTDSRQQYLDADIPGDIAELVAGTPYLIYYLAVVDIAEDLGVLPALAAQVFFQVGESLKLNWMSERLVNLTVCSHWQAMARESFVDDLEEQQATLTRGVLQLMAHDSVDITQGMAQWQQRQAPMIQRWLGMVNQIAAGDITDYALYQVAIRELMDLADCTRYQAQN
jgi:glutamate dehydrogenase